MAQALLSRGFQATFLPARDHPYGLWSGLPSLDLSEHKYKRHSLMIQAVARLIQSHQITTLAAEPLHEAGRIYTLGSCLNPGQN